MSIMVSQITSLIVYSTIYLGADHRKHQSSMSLAFVKEIHQWPVNSLYKRPVMRKMKPFEDVIMALLYSTVHYLDCIIKLKLFYIEILLILKF